MNIVSVLGQFCPKVACPLGASFTKIFDMLVSVLALETASTCMFKFVKTLTVKILNNGTCMSEQTVKILIRLLLRSSLIRIYTVCHSFYIF